MGSEEALWALRGAQGDDDDPPTHPLPALAMPAKCTTDGATLVNERSVVCGREGLSVVLSIAHQVMALTFSSRNLRYALSTQRCTASRVRSLQIGYCLPSFLANKVDKTGPAPHRYGWRARRRRWTLASLPHTRSP